MNLVFAFERENLSDQIPREIFKFLVLFYCFDALNF